ncbi:methylated-DNA--protein-cysteine methyltransferase [Candidatus Velamenicoccus archaeovorus]|uniref:methylated-DNA--[protein]-cysteine S-methyltransferase n=1 Tax=Velamenicoccus archaeovorus TaxID=1930593 RepID=A0A410P5S8_VELA1|nr:MGMT family protein [Candidatus Velamenicoccus archaeovorus]QAT17503.1 methylated-DNA--protein-cysteine methyltransferase [Candidatus Velamenicoccus archaeovorus]
MRQKLTPFQKAVYAATMEIPLGETRSYAWIARRIGSPKSSRAVGNALNKNPYAPFVPCHRVISSDGSLGGFRGGLVKKLRLLKQERKFSRAKKSMVVSR